MKTETRPNIKPGMVLELVRDYTTQFKKGTKATVLKMRKDSHCRTGFRVSVNLEGGANIHRFDAGWFSGFDFSLKEPEPQKGKEMKTETAKHPSQPLTMQDLIELVEYLLEKSEGDRLYFDGLYVTEDETFRQAVERMATHFGIPR